MKRIIPTLVSIVLIGIIVVVSGYCSGYRIVKSNDKTSISKMLDEEAYVTKKLNSNFITLIDGDSKTSTTYNDMGVTGEVVDVKTGVFVQDTRNAKMVYSMPSVSTLTYLNDDRQDEVDGILAFDDDGNIYLEGGTDSNILDISNIVMALQALINSDSTGNVVIDLDDYIAPVEQSEYKKTALETIDTLNNFKVEYTDGFTLTSAILAKRGLLTINNDGTVSCSITQEDAQDICGKNLTGYNTIGTTFKFKNHNGETINVDSVTYGDYIDYAAEGEYLLGLVQNFESESDRVPIMKQEALYDIDDTYVELDKTEQHAYYYQHGELVWDTDVVTGLPTTKRETPSGIYFIINRTQNQQLVGETWDVKVDRWLGVTYTGVGFHDASWRSTFGGTIYKTNGSHGCINTPTDKMYELWDMIEVNTPVVIY
jgi:hypothetical protein